MCTVTFLPLEKNEFILTSSRDENPLRPTALVPEFREYNHQQLIYPQDPLHKGTWIASSKAGKTVCLLNGAFEKHIPQPPYKKSRGLVVLDSFAYNNFSDFCQQYDFDAIEPFTLVGIQNAQLYVLKWDGAKTHCQELDFSKPHIWSSVTLYTKEIIRKREEWFNTWQTENSTYSVRDIRAFHHHAGDGDITNDIKINRSSTMSTLSITSVSLVSKNLEMIYEDIKTNNAYSQQASLVS